ncbi:beta-1,4-glucuronyltransferase 1 [Sipha flava]|uniref:Beta-1,4-glucuronyltransferase 1 n=1 Tax=Sipha flava TaxID=143950 RepID=A0A2S2R011_9HEMI|nr:beta-1,4-glucuronyltransferase 1 [Sipha flava]XP_025411581.1 beta-1,4-glucuronyltransferase 1 [Sipha flava]
MLTRRNWLLRLSVVLNVAVLFYFGSYLTIRNGNLENVEEVQVSGRNLASIDASPNGEKETAAYYYNSGPGGSASYPELALLASIQPIAGQQQQGSSVQTPVQGTTLRDDGHVMRIKPKSTAVAAVEPSDPSGSAADPSVVVAGSGSAAAIAPAEPWMLEKKDAPTQQQTSTTTTTTTTTASGGTSAVAAAMSNAGATSQVRPLRELLGCQDKPNRRRIAQRGDYWVLYNYVPARRWFRCDESITYTTHADFTFLDNLEPLLDRWRGPISVALYTPGTDFVPTLASIRYLRQCGSPLVAEYVTFHLYFGSGHVPKSVPHADHDINAPVANCSAPPPWVNSSAVYKGRKKLLYPVNVGRNVARESATTHYVLPSDIELYPSPGVIDGFMDMVRRQDPPLRRPKPMVFPLPIFELASRMKLPADKRELLSMLKNGSAITFHKKVCPDCHTVPKFKEWASAKPKPGVSVFHTGKRTGYHLHWEPIFIGTHSDPLYDERLSWEGKMDKMTQGYTLCVLDYEFHILDNAFLTHKPGIKTLKKDPARQVLASKTFNLIKKVILPELKVLYGVKKGCAV